MKHDFSIHHAYDDEEPVDIALVRQRMQSEPCIAVTEEFGYHEWIWFPPVPLDDLEQHWREMQASRETSFQERLGGSWYEMEHMNHRIVKVGKLIMRQYLNTEMRLFYSIYAPTNFTAQICWDDDATCLNTPDGRVVYHAGYSGKIDPIKDTVDMRKWQERWVWLRHHICASLPLKRIKGMPKRRAKRRAMSR